MASNHGTNENARLEALRRREAALRGQITAEQVRQQKRRERIHARHADITGACLLADLEHNPQLGTLLEEVLKRHSNPRDAEFLRARGWRL